MESKECIWCIELVSTISFSYLFMAVRASGYCSRYVRTEFNDNE